MAASSRAQVLDLYRAMLRESKHFSAYNYRMYAVRRIRDAFRENKSVKDPVEIQALVNKAKRDLEIIRRQSFVKQVSYLWQRGHVKCLSSEVIKVSKTDVVFY
ncbi:LYR motif-containing protein 4 isoform X1 [Alexandromys fortis]|uniref:LYR motif-containing protein 4 isoform X1 n=1 Tax=Alexandromys fortis TaxID=100897 RepID=UPI00215367BF|nr:LYR motif-containing protein 4 isoform X1 [Microtus fortis]